MSECWDIFWMPLLEFGPPHVLTESSVSCWFGSVHKRNLDLDQWNSFFFRSALLAAINVTMPLLLAFIQCVLCLWCSYFCKILWNYVNWSELLCFSHSTSDYSLNICCAKMSTVQITYVVTLFLVMGLFSNLSLVYCTAIHRVHGSLRGALTEL